MNLKSKILFILFFLLIFFGVFHLKGKDLVHNNNDDITAQLTCQAPHREADKYTYFDQSIPLYKDDFCPGEDIWVKVSPKIGDHDYVYKKARLYVVHLKPGTQLHDLTRLKDVTGDGVETIFIQPEGACENYIKIWRDPVVGEKGYTVVVDFSPFGIYNKGRDILDVKLSLGTQRVFLKSISFNHDLTSNCCDAINIRMNINKEVHVPEWKTGGRTYPVAYIRNKPITVKAVFSAAPDVSSAVIYASEVCGNFDDIMPETVTFDNGESNEMEFRLAAKTPNEIQSFYQRWHWYCKSIETINSQKFSNEIPIGSSINKIFIILDEPQGPWTRTGQSEPWVDALEYSCLWADGEITPEGAAERITYNLYNNLGCVYDSVSRYTDSKNQPFNFAGFMNGIPNIYSVNCYDMGKALVTFSNILGCCLRYNYSDNFGNLNCIRPIGTSRRCQESYNNHGFGSLNSKVFDACLKVDTCMNPAQWMTNLLWSDYKEMVIRKGSPDSPQSFSFDIVEPVDRLQGISEDKLKWLREKYQFNIWPGQTGKVIPGVTISTKTVEELKGMSQIWKKANYSLETIQCKTFLKICQWWKLMDEQLLATMVVGHTFEAAKQYLILHYANTNRQPPLIKPPGKEFGICIGNVCFVTPACEKGSFSTIDFIRHNVIIMLEAKGELTGKLREIAEGLDDILKIITTQKSKECYKELEDIPRITEFSCQNTTIQLGDTVYLNLRVKNPKISELHHYWRMTGGGIEEDRNGNLMYYGGEPGKHKIMVTTMNDLGLYDKSKPLVITVLEK